MPRLNRIWFCPRCGHMWELEPRTPHTSERQRRFRWLGCALVVVALLGFTLCMLWLLARL
jgi:hypothetical protein